MASKVNLENIPLAGIFWGLFCMAFFAAGAVTDVLAFHYVGWATVNVFFISMALNIIDRLQFKADFKFPQYALIYVWLTGAFMFQTINPDAYQAELAVGDSLYLRFLRMSEPIGLFLCVLLIIGTILFCAVASKRGNSIKYEKVIGCLGHVKKWKQDSGKILLDSFNGTKFPHPKRTWKACSSEDLSAGDRIRVLALDKKNKMAEVGKASEVEQSRSCSTPITESDRIKSRNFGFAAAALITTGFGADIMDVMPLTWLLPIGVGAGACSLVLLAERKTDEPIGSGTLAWLWTVIGGGTCYAWFLL